jgi:hypothetical protein
MPIVTQCTAPGCKTLTMGAFCVEHEARVTRVFVRGRPWSPAAASTSRQSTMTFPPMMLNARKAWAQREAARAHR